jgi:hypothetical protein
MSNTTATLDSIGLDSLLDTVLDDIADLPEFKPFPAGAHRVLCSLDQKVIAGKPAVELALKLVETLELANASDTAPAEGSTCNVAYFLDNEYGLGNLKIVAVPFAAALGVSTIREAVEQVKDMEAVIITGLRADKTDKEKFYLNIKDIQVI